jgi:hypothetical protein
MKSSLRVCLGLLVVSSLFAFAGCGDDDDDNAGGGGTKAQGGETHGGGGADGAAKCEEIAHLCHPVDDGDGPLHECHEQSEVGDSAKCEEIYDSCIAQCQAAHDAAEGGAGAGSGGVASGGAAAGGAAGANLAGTAGSAG